MLSTNGVVRIAGTVADPHWLSADRLRVYSWAALICYGAFFGIWAARFLLAAPGSLVAPGGDFVVFWSASHLALQGEPAAAYQIERLWPVELAAVPSLALNHGILPWLYPPTYLLLVLPLALLPYWVALLAFLGASAALYLQVLRSIVPWREVWPACMAFPGIALACATGQNAMLTAGCAGLALLLMRSRPVLAGILLGLLTAKPHLALLFPIALVCARSWRALAAMALSAVLLALVSLAAFGPGVFEAFVHNAVHVRGSLEAGEAIQSRVPTMFILMRTLGASVGLSYAVHGATAALALLAVVRAWRHRYSFALQAAALLTATLMTSVYLYDYDLCFLGLVIGWIGAHGWRNGWLRGERELLLVLWLLPPCGLLVVAWTEVQWMPLMLALCLWQIVRRMRLERLAMEREARAVVDAGQGEGNV